MLHRKVADSHHIWYKMVPDWHRNILDLLIWVKKCLDRMYIWQKKLLDSLRGKLSATGLWQKKVQDLGMWQKRVLDLQLGHRGI